MDNIIRVINPIPGISRMEIFPQNCGDNAERIFIVDIDEVVFTIRMMDDAVWVGEALTYKVSSELVTVICKLIKSNG